MGKSPKDSKVAAKPQRRKAANVVSFEEARKASRVRLGQRKEFNIARGALREGALYDPNESPAESKQPKRPKLVKHSGKEAPARAARPKATKQQAPASPKPTARPKAARAVEQVDRPSASEKKSRMAERVEVMREAREERRRARTKAKADKKFDAQYGEASSAATFASGKRRGADAPSSRDNAGGPRAAVYEGKMGALHKKSSKLQSKGGGRVGDAAGGMPIPSVRLPRVSRRMGTALVTVVACAACAFSLYGPAQQYYTQMRETDRLQAEYAAVAARSDALQSSIDSLQTDAGIEDKAHADLGYVKSGERTATVKGIDFDDSKQFSTNVVPGSVPAPETWYSPVLDAFFDYSK